VRFAFIKNHAHEFPINLMCRVLEVARSGYYAWLRRKPGPREQRRTELVEAIRQVHVESREIYGSPRVHQELQSQGVECCQNTVAKLMQEHEIRAKTCRKFRVSTTDSRHGNPIAPNTLDQRFERAAPDQAWVADITYIPTDEGWLYLAAIVDLYSRMVVGWATAAHLRAELTCHALRNALLQRQPTGPVLHHSDRGVQYACDDYQELIQRFGLQPSMSRTGNCYDNAVMESFFGTLKTELVHHERYATREQAHQSLFEYIEVFYNRQRRHSSLGYLSPYQFEDSLN
jgi:transposase InsO family protein